MRQFYKTLTIRYKDATDLFFNGEINKRLNKISKIQEVNFEH